MDRHQTTRVRHELVRRTVTVAAVERLTPHMLRLRFASPELAGFASAAPDDHLKLLVPDGAGGTIGRDYTPRAFDGAAGTLTIDFALHEAGPATRWAEGAQVGDTVMVGGPKGSRVVADDFDWVLLVGDETALPSIGRRLEELRPEVPVTVLVVVETEADRQPLAGRANLIARWIARADTGADDAALLRRLLDEQPLPAGDGYVWIAAEAGVARTLRAHVIDGLGHPREWTKAAGYWSRAAAGTHETIED